MGDSHDHGHSHGSHSHATHGHSHDDHGHAHSKPSSRTLKTLSRADAEFTSYLDGSFSDSAVALPLRSLNVGTQTEEVTFAVVPLSEIDRPAAWFVAQTLVRPASLVFSIGPMLAILARLYSHKIPFDSFLALGCFIGVVAFQIAINMFNDYGDHMRGQDRVRPRGGSRAIQRGWVRANTVRRAALGLTGFAALCGVPAIIRSPVIIAAGAALLVALEFAFQRLRLKARGWTEILAFALTGPLLTSAYAWAISGRIEWADAGLGGIFGAIALMYFHSANFENIMSDSQAGAHTWATRAGFDSSQKFFAFTALLIIAITTFDILVFERDASLVAALIAQVAFLVPVTKRVRNLASPLSSELVGLRNEPVKLSWITVVAIIGGYVWIASLSV